MIMIIIIVVVIGGGVADKKNRAFQIIALKNFGNLWLKVTPREDVHSF